MSVLALVGAVSLTSCKKKVNPGFTANPTDAKVGQAVSFVDSEAAERKNASISWDFGDGSKSYDRNPSHVFSKAGKYMVHQTVTINTNAEKGKGVSETFSMEITVTGGATSTFTASPSTVAVGENVVLTSTSTGTDTYWYSYTSTNGANDVYISSSMNANVVFTTPGTYTITLKASMLNDPNNMSLSTQTVTVTGNLPNANAATRNMLLGKWNVTSDIGNLSGNGSASPFTCALPAWALPDNPAYTPSIAHTSMNFLSTGGSGGYDGACYVINAQGNQTTGNKSSWTLSPNGAWLTLEDQTVLYNTGFDDYATFKIASISATAMTLEWRASCGNGTATATKVRTVTFTK